MKRLAHALLDTLVPHERNGYRPHLLRTTGMLVALFAFAALAAGSLVYRATLSENGYLASVLPAVLVDLANQDRVENALSSLTVSPLLTKAAELKATDMAAKGYFAHVSPDGKEPWYFFNEAGYAFVYAGENLAVNFDDSAAVNAAWMNSPAHRANILGSHYTEIGIATARGFYKDKEVTFVVQEFGSPAATPAEATEAPLIAQSGAPVVEESQPAAAVASAAVSAATTTPVRMLVAVVDTTVSSPDATYVAVKDENAIPAPAPEASSTAPAPIPASTVSDRFFSSPMLVLEFAYGVLGVLLLLVFVGVSMVSHERQQRHLGRIALLFLALLVLYLAVGYGVFSGAAIR